MPGPGCGLYHGHHRRDSTAAHRPRGAGQVRPSVALLGVYEALHHVERVAVRVQLQPPPLPPGRRRLAVGPGRPWGARRGSNLAAKALPTLTTPPATRPDRGPGPARSHSMQQAACAALQQPRCCNRQRAQTAVNATNPAPPPQKNQLAQPTSSRPSIPRSADTSLLPPADPPPRRRRRRRLFSARAGPATLAADRPNPAHSAPHAAARRGRLGAGGEGRHLVVHGQQEPARTHAFNRRLHPPTPRPAPRVDTHMAE